MKFPRKMKDLRDVAGRRRESLTGGTTARPGSKIGENVRSGRLGAIPQTLGDLCPLSGPSSGTIPARLLGPHPSPSNPQTQPIGPNRTVAAAVALTVACRRGCAPAHWKPFPSTSRCARKRPQRWLCRRPAQAGPRPRICRGCGRLRHAATFTATSYTPGAD